MLQSVTFGPITVNTFCCNYQSIQRQGRQVVNQQKLNFFHHLMLSNRTKIMAIVNMTPDSFAGDGLLDEFGSNNNAALNKINSYAGLNIDFIDVGGESTRPGGLEIPVEEELSRIIPVIRTINNLYPNFIISADTSKAAVAREALAAGATIINDVSGLMGDPEIIDVAINYKAPVVIMHSNLSKSIDQIYNISTPRPQHNIVAEVIDDLHRITMYAISRGLTREQIIIDPGIGFGKTLEQNLSLIKNLNYLKCLGFPILLGASRKSFIGYITQKSVNERLSSSLAAAAIGIMQGADIVRVHDPLESVEVAQIADALRQVD